MWYDLRQSRRVSQSGSRRSALRNALPSIVDRKYQGVRISRQQLSAGSDDEDPSAIDLDYMLANPDKEHTVDEEVDDGLSASNRSSDSVDSGSEDDDQSRQPSITPADEQAGDVTTSLKKSKEDDIQKGQAVKAQLVRGNILRLYLLTCVSSYYGIRYSTRGYDYKSQWLLPTGFLQ